MANREAVEALGWRERRQKLPYARESEVRLAPPSYVVKELGGPRDPVTGKAWDRGVKEIEGYRQEHGVSDKRHALGREPQSISQRAAREAAQRRLREAQLRLGREHQLAQAKKLRRSIERGFSLGR